MATKGKTESSDLHSEWEAAYGHPLSTDDLHEIQHNLSEFVRLLLEGQGDSGVLDEGRAA